MNWVVGTSQNDGSFPKARLAPSLSRGAVVLAAVAFHERLLRLAASFTDYYWLRRWGLLLYLTAGTIAISTGLTQVWHGLIGRIGVLQRTLGKCYVGAVGVGTIGGAYMALRCVVDETR
jgi:hypothetical protein